MKYLALILLPLLAACSNFDQRWKTESIPAAPDTLAGRWAGEWHSYTGHRGDLRALIIPETPEPSAAPTTQPAQRHYRATFKATFWAIYTSEYSVDLTATPTPDGESFTGSKNLGPFAGGNYQYSGLLRHDDLQSSYQSAVDHGTFNLHRLSH